MNTGEDEWDASPEISNVRVTPAKKDLVVKPVSNEKLKLESVNAAAKTMQSDAPACNTCGHITIRSGTCYKCLNCGNSMGCS